MKGWFDMEEIVNGALLTGAVFAALVTSAVNIIVALITNRKVSNLERKKQEFEITKYRFERLYDLVSRWYEFDMKYEGDTPEEIASSRLVNMFLDDTGRYRVARPFLDKESVALLDRVMSEGHRLLGDLISGERPDGSRSEDYVCARDLYFDNGQKFSDLLKGSIDDQLDGLLLKIEE